MVNIPSLLSYLESEITHIRAESQEPGWTKWAIVGSLATILWLLLSEVEKGLFTAENLFLLILISSIIYDGISVLFSVLFDDYSTEFPLNNRLFLTTKFSHRRFPILLMLTRYVFIIFLVYHFSPKMDLATTILAYIINGFYGLALLVVLMISFLRFPLPNQSEDGNKILEYTIASILFIVPLYLTAKYIQLPFHANTPLSVSDIRITGLICATFYLLHLFSKLTRRSPLLNSLVDIRRNLVLGHLSATSAVDQIDIALAGLKVSDILQQYVRRFLTSIEYVDSEIRLALSEFNAMEKYSSLSPVSEEQKTIINALHNSVLSHINKATDANEKVNAAYKPIIWRVELIKSYTRVSSDELDNVLETINVARKNLQENTKNLREKIGTFLDTL